MMNISHVGDAIFAMIIMPQVLRHWSRFCTFQVRGSWHHWLKPLPSFIYSSLSLHAICVTFPPILILTHAKGTLSEGRTPPRVKETLDRLSLGLKVEGGGWSISWFPGLNGVIYCKDGHVFRAKPPDVTELQVYRCVFVGAQCVDLCEYYS